MMAATGEARPKAATVLVSMPLPCNGEGVSYTCTSIVRSFDRSALGASIFTPYGHVGVKASTRLTETLPVPLQLLPFWRIRRLTTRLNERSYVEGVRRAAEDGNVIAYVWPEPSLSLVRKILDSGVPIVRESVNCHQATGKKILDAEYIRLGLVPQHPMTEHSIEFERQALDHYDAIFCSNPHAEQSMIDNGVPRRKIKEASFGWDPDRFRGHSKALAPIDSATFIFAGSICVRKGAHLLLRYWARSQIRGRLILAGEVEPALAEVCAEYLTREDVQVIKYTRDLGPYYRSADAFVFPSLEEGGPQVTYEAAGCGLPLITSPMGAGRVAVDQSTGFIIDPFDEAGWIAAMQAIADDRDLRRRMGNAASQRASQFTWQKVGEARERVFQEVASRSIVRAGARAAPDLVSDAWQSEV